MTRRWALLAGVLILAGSQPDGHRRPWRSARDSAAEQQVGSGPIVSSAARTAATEYGTFPLAFEPNLGQSERPVEFLARGPGYGVFLTGGHAVIGCRARLPPVATRSPCASWERIRRPSRQVRTQQPAWPTTSSAMTRRVGLRTSRRIGGFATPTSTRESISCITAVSGHLNTTSSLLLVPIPQPSRFATTVRRHQGSTRTGTSFCRLDRAA